MTNQINLSSSRLRWEVRILSESTHGTCWVARVVVAAPTAPQAESLALSDVLYAQGMDPVAVLSVKKVRSAPQGW